MSGKDDVVELEGNLTEALAKGGDAALDEALRGIAVEDDGQPDEDDDADAAAVAAAAASDDNAGKGKTDDDDAAGGDGEADGKGKQAADVAASKAAEGGKSDAAKGDQGSRPGDDEQPAPVQNKRGTGTIPYEVLSAARQRAARADQLEADLAEANRKLAEAQQQLINKPVADKQSGDAAKTVADIDDLSDEDFADLPPEVQKLHRKVKAMEAKLEQVGTTTTNYEQEQKQRANDDVQAAIDDVPDIAEWQSKNGALWEIACRFDGQLRNDPSWSGKSFTDRFKEVSRLVREEVGLPPRQDTAAADKTKPGKKAGAAAAKADDADAIPSSLSDIQGGGAPDLDVHDSIEKTSAVGLASRMANMRDSDIDALLSKMS